MFESGHHGQLVQLFIVARLGLALRPFRLADDPPGTIPDLQRLPGEVLSYTAQATRFNGRARSIRSRSLSVFITSQRSLRRCTLSQKSGLLPNTRARMSAVAAVTFLRLPHNSLTCLR